MVDELKARLEKYPLEDKPTFSVGDTVRIKKDLTDDMPFTLDYDGEMKSNEGRTTTVSTADLSRYGSYYVYKLKIDFGLYSWSYPMLEKIGGVKPKIYQINK